MGSFFDDTVVLFSLTFLSFVPSTFSTPSSFSGSLAWPQNSTLSLSDRHSASTTEKYFLFCDLLVRVGSAKNSKKCKKKRKKRSRGDIGTPRPIHDLTSCSSRCLCYTSVSRSFVSPLELRRIIFVLPTSPCEVGGWGRSHDDHEYP
jgi:hypothetical protein